MNWKTNTLFKEEEQRGFWKTCLKPSGAKPARNPRLQALPLGNKDQSPGEGHTGAKWASRERDGTSRQAGMGKDKDLGATSTSIPGHDSLPSLLFHKSHSTHSFCWSLWPNNYQTCISMSICLCNRWLVSMTTLRRPLYMLWPRPRMPFPALSALYHLLQLCSHYPGDLFHGCLLTGTRLLAGTLSSALY